MGINVDFILMGEVSDRLEVPSGTLRGWTDKLEEFGIHYVMRNNRNERIYYDTDLEIFKFLKDMKDVYGRRTTNRDLFYMLAEKAKQGEFTLRKKEDAPHPSNPSNKTADLLNQEDIKQLMQSERVRQFIQIIISENTRVMRDELIEEIRDSVREEVRLELREENAKLTESISKIEENQNKSNETISKIEEIQNKSNESISKIEEKQSKSSESISKIEEIQTKSKESISKIEEIQTKSKESISKIEEKQDKSLDILEESVKERRADRIKREAEEAERIKKETAASQENSRGFLARLFGAK